MTDMECDHPPPPTECRWCGGEAVVSVDDVGACANHLDEVFEQAATPLAAILMAATQAFGNTDDDQEGTT